MSEEVGGIRIPTLLMIGGAVMMVAAFIFGPASVRILGFTGLLLATVGWFWERLK